MLGHLSFGVSELARSAEFYDRILGPLGYVRVWSNPRGVGFGEKGGGEKGISWRCSHNPSGLSLRLLVSISPSRRRAARRWMRSMPRR